MKTWEITKCSGKKEMVTAERLEVHRLEDMKVAVFFIANAVTFRFYHYQALNPVPEMAKLEISQPAQKFHEEDVNESLAYKNAVLQLKIETLKKRLELKEAHIRDLNTLNDNLLEKLKNNLNTQGISEINQDIITRNGG